MKEIYRVNYANEKHHRQQLREKIDPRIIEQIEIDRNPSLNYKNAFKAVYYDELEKTMKFQEEKKMRVVQNPQMMLNSRINENPISRNSSLPSLNYSMLPLQNMSINETITNDPRKSYVDYDEERTKKFENLIEKGYDGGQSFFRAQDQYQRRKQESNKLMNLGLLQQLQLKQNRKLQETVAHNQETEFYKENRRHQIQNEISFAERQRLDHLQLGSEVKQQAELERMKRHHKSYFQFNQIGRHNPITNPIEYHIDNPYIMQKFSNKVQTDPQQMSYQYNGEGQKSQSQLQQDYS